MFATQGQFPPRELSLTTQSLIKEKKIIVSDPQILLGNNSPSPNLINNTKENKTQKNLYISSLSKIKNNNLFERNQQKLSSIKYCKSIQNNNIALEDCKSDLNDLSKEFQRLGRTTLTYDKRKNNRSDYFIDNILKKQERMIDYNNIGNENCQQKEEKFNQKYFRNKILELNPKPSIENFDELKSREFFSRSVNEVNCSKFSKIDEKIRREKVKIEKLVNEIPNDNQTIDLNLTDSKILRLYIESNENAWMLTQNKNKYDSYNWVKLDEVKNLNSLDLPNIINLYDIEEKYKNLVKEYNLLQDEFNDAQEIIIKGMNNDEDYFKRFIDESKLNKDELTKLNERIEIYERNQKNSSEEILNLNKIIEKLKVEKAKDEKLKNEEIGNLRNKFANELSIIKEGLKNKEESGKNLQLDLEKIRIDLSEKQNEYQQLLLKYEELEKSNGDLLENFKKIKKELSDEIEQKNQLISDKNTIINHNNKLRSTSEEREINFTNEITELSKEKEELKNEILLLTQENSSKNEKIKAENKLLKQDYEKNISELSHKYEKLKDEFKRKEEKFNEKVVENIQLTSELEDREETIKSIGYEIEGYLKQIKEKDQLILTIKEANKSLEEKFLIKIGELEMLKANENQAKLKLEELLEKERELEPKNQINDTKIVKLESENKDLKEQVNELTSQIEEYENFIEEHNQLIEKYKKLKETSKNKEIEDDKILNEYLEEINILSKEKDILLKENEEEKLKSTNLLEIKNKEISEYLMKIQILTDQNENLVKELNEFEFLNNKLKEDLEIQRQENKTQRYEYEEEINRLTSDLEELNTLFEGEEKEKKELCEMRSILEEEIKKLNIKSKDLQNQIENISNENKELLINGTVLQNANDLMTTKLEHKEKELKALDEKFKVLSKKNSELEVEIKNFTNKLNESQLKIKELEGIIIDDQEKESEKILTIERLNNEIDLKSNLLETLQNDVSVFKVSYNEINQLNMDLQKKAKYLETLLEQKQKIYQSNITIEMSNLNNEIENLKKELKLKEDLIVIQKDDLEKIHQDYEKSIQKIKEFDKNMEESQNKIGILELELITKSNSLDNQTKNLELEKEKNFEILKKIQNLEKELDLANENILSLKCSKDNSDKEKLRIEKLIENFEIDSKSKIDELSTEIKKISSEKTVLESKLIEQDHQKTKEINEILEKIELKKIETEKIIEEKNGVIKDLNQYNEELKSKLNSVQNQIDEKSYKIDEINMLKKSYEESILNQNSKIAELTLIMNETSKNLEIKEKLISELTEANQSQREEIKNKTSILEESRLNQELLKNKINQLEIGIEELKKLNSIELKEKELKLNDITEKYDNIRVYCEKYKGLIENNTFDKLQTQVTSLQNENNTLKSEFEMKIKKEAEISNISKQNLINQCDELKKGNSDLIMSIKILESENFRLKEELKSSNDSVKTIDYIEKIKNLENSIVEKIEESLKLKYSSDHLKRLLEDCDIELNALKEELNQKKNEIKNLNQQLQNENNSKEIIYLKDKEIEKLNESIQNYKSDFSNSFKKFQTDIEKKNTKIESQNLEINNYSRKVNELNSEIQKLNELIKNKEKNEDYINLRNDFIIKNDELLKSKQSLIVIEKENKDLINKVKNLEDEIKIMKDANENEKLKKKELLNKNEIKPEILEIKNPDKSRLRNPSGDAQKNEEIIQNYVMQVNSLRELVMLKEKMNENLVKEMEKSQKDNSENDVKLNLIDINLQSIEPNANDDINSLRSKLDNFKKIMINYKENEDSLKKQVQLIKEDFKNLQTEFNSQKEYIQKIESFEGKIKNFDEFKGIFNKVIENYKPKKDSKEYEEAFNKIRVYFQDEKEKKGGFFSNLFKKK